MSFPVDAKYTLNLKSHMFIHLSGFFWPCHPFHSVIMFLELNVVVKEKIRKLTDL